VDARARVTVVDSHQHFWDPSAATYAWMTDEVASIRRRFMPDDLRPLLIANGVDFTVVVQARSDLDETRELLRLAAATDFIAGVVGWADLTSPSLADELAALQRADGGDRLVGIRHQVHDEPDPGWLLRDGVVRGLHHVRDAGLVYDLLLRPRELPAALHAVRAVDGLDFVIDHIAKPRIAAGPNDQEWERGLGAFADLPNVSCKLSGLVTEADWHSWRIDDLAPYVERVVSWFGEDRLLFGSDWPVCTLAATYDEVMQTARALLPGHKPFGENAIEIYGLRQASPPLEGGGRRGQRSTTA
jgi:L-fuconolactonase